jgi:hypothetical protein
MSWIARASGSYSGFYLTEPPLKISQACAHRSQLRTKI